VANSAAFELTAAELERITDLDRLESRGTLRLALKKALFDSRSVDVAQMMRVVERILPGELAARSIEGHDAVCEKLAMALKTSELSSKGVQSPDAIFQRLIRR